MQAQKPTREEKGKVIFQAGEQIYRVNGFEYHVRSQSNREIFYHVTATESGWICDCPDFTYRHVQCKHIFAVVLSVQIRQQVEAKRIEPIADTTVCIFCGSSHITKYGIRKNKYGDLQKFQCIDCKKFFSWNLGFEKMKHNPKAITASMIFYFQGESLRSVQKSLRLLGCEVSHQTIHNWIAKYTELMAKYLDKIIPNVSSTWRADEIYLKMKGDTKYLFALIDDETRFWLAQQVADKKGISDVRPMFKEGRELAQKIPSVLVTDGAPNFVKAFKHELYFKNKQTLSVHMRHIHMKGDLNNNKMERFNEEIRTREKTMRSLKSEETPIIEGMKIFHNFVRPHMSLEGKTPAEASGIEITGEDKYRTIIQNASYQTKIDREMNQTST